MEPYNSESSFRLFETRYVTNEIIEKAEAIAKTRLQGRQLADTLKWIRGSKRTHYQMRQLFKRWGEPMPNELFGKEHEANRCGDSSPQPPS